MQGAGLLKSMGVTMKNFLRVPFTVQYPDRRVGLLGAAKEAGMSPGQFVMKRPKDSLKAVAGLAKVPEKVPQSPRYRGNEFTWYEDRCTGCASCAKYCPLGIIEIVTHPGGIDVQEGESYAIDVFDIDIGRCMFCGLCVEACPYDALHMGSHFEYSNYVRGALVISVDDLRNALKRPSHWFRPQLHQRDYTPFRDPLPDHHAAGRHDQPTEEQIRERWIEERE